MESPARAKRGKKLNDFFQRTNGTIMTEMKTKYRKYGEAPTVEEVIKALEKMPQDARCFVRTKYPGSSTPVEDIPLHHRGISEMHPDGKPINVTFLV